MKTYVIFLSSNMDDFECVYLMSTYDLSDKENWCHNECEASEFTLEEAEEVKREVLEAFDGCEVDVEIYEKETFDIMFNDGEKSDRKGCELSFQECMDYIEQHNGTDESYFADYKGGVVSIVCNQNDDVRYEEDIF